jgi:hypothetical protein
MSCCYSLTDVRRLSEVNKSNRTFLQKIKKSNRTFLQTGHLEMNRFGKAQDVQTIILPWV